MKITRFFGLSVFFLFFIILTLNSSTQATPLGTKSTAPPNLALKDLPAGAQASISGALGKDNPAYHFTPVVDGWRIRHLSQGLDGALNSKGLRLRVAEADLSLKLLAYGRGAALEPLAQTVPLADANRLEYQRGPVTEWYLSGPIGLEQGFTVYAPPESSLRTQAKSETKLTLALLLETDLNVKIDAGEKGLTLSLPNNQAVLRYGGLTAFDAAGRELPAALEYSALKKELLIHVNDTGASYPLTIDPWIQSAKLTASDGIAGDQFGWSVAVSGNTIVVGAYKAAVGGKAEQGAAYVFVQPGAGWAGGLNQSAKLIASDGVAGDWLGWSVSISGDTIVVGASKATIGGQPRCGVAYVFVKPSGGWTGNLNQDAKLVANVIAEDRFGWSVSISGDTVVVGAIYQWIKYGGEGAAYVFVKPVAGWLGTLNPTAMLLGSDASNSAYFGGSVSINGDTIVVGADNTGLPDGTIRKGAAYVFIKPGANWSGTLLESAKLIASDGAPGNHFGNSVALNGDTVIVGAMDVKVGDNAIGAAYVFVKPGSGWFGTLPQSAKLIRSNYTGLVFKLGYSVAISGDVVVVGSWDSVSPNWDQGAAYVYIKPGGGWAGDLTQSAKLVASDGAAHDYFGYSVAISGDTVVVGAYKDDIGSNVDQGSAYVFRQSLAINLPLIIR